MTLNAKLSENFRQPDVGGIVYLYSLDIQSITGNANDIYYFVEGTISGTTVKYNGVEYFPANVKCEGFEVSGEGTAPRPTIKVANVGVGAGVTIANAANNYDDLLGGIISRKITKKEHLDGEADPDVNAFYEEIWIISHKNAHTKDYLEFEMSAYLDFENTYTPNRLILRDVCTHLYRTYDDGFDYTNATCPWADGTHGYYWDRDGAKTTTSGDDTCGKRLGDCKLRYVTPASSYEYGTSAPGGASTGDLWLRTDIIPNIWYRYNGSSWVTPPAYDQLPTRAFPMVAKLRIY